jgi:hypothetical protein
MDRSMKTKPVGIPFDLPVMLRVLTLAANAIDHNSKDELNVQDKIIVLKFADLIDALFARCFPVNFPLVGEVHSARAFVDALWRWEDAFANAGAGAKADNLKRASKLIRRFQKHAKP